MFGVNEIEVKMLTMYQQEQLKLPMLIRLGLPE